MSKTLLTDLYQLTMNASYHQNNKDDVATFDLFIRKLPQDWGYFIAAGIEEAIDYVTSLEFKDEEINYLREQKIFSEDYLDTLKDFKFEGEVHAVKEGTPIMPNTPVMRITAKRSQAQLIESTLLNIINYQTMIVSKANRVVNAAGDAAVLDFGLRRAQGEDAALQGARAAYIGGAIGTSNVKAGMEYGIPIKGTHAHSYVMSHDSEIEAFRSYVKTFPNETTLLIDTYDTLQGARNAAIVAKELEQEGNRLGAVRLDSGDLGALSIQVRQILDNDGLDYVKVVASNDLNEYKIENLKSKGAEINGYGVGTEMITAKPVAAISGVYKLVEDNGGYKIKLAPGKQTYPGKKQVYRVEQDGEYQYDILALADEKTNGKPLLEEVIRNGKRVREKPSLEATRSYALSEVDKLPEHLRKTRVEQAYEVKIGDGLQSVVDRLSKKYDKAA